MSNLVSVLKKDQKFINYLNGSFSKSKVAVLEKILFKDTDKETAVFNISEVNEIKKPASLIIWLRAIRAHYLLFTLIPLVSVLILLSSMGISYRPSIAIFSVLSVLFLQITTHFFNDYFDHMKAVDTLSNIKGSRVIQKGWLPGHKVFLAGKITTLLSVFFAVPLLLYNTWLVLPIGLIALLIILKFSSFKFGLKYNGFLEITLFFISGPLLTLGYSWLLSGNTDASFVFMGTLFGVISANYFFSKNISEMLDDQLVAIKTLPRILGFDASRRVLLFSVLLPPLIVGLWMFSFSESIPDFRLAPVIVLEIIASIYLFRLACQVKSCLASKLLIIKKSSLILHFITGMALIFSLK